MSLLILTEDEILSPSINPPSSGEEVGGGAEDLDCFQFVDDCHMPDEAPDITDVEMTPRLVAMQVHLQAIGELLSMTEVVEIPHDPDYVTHSVATWPNEGISQTDQSNVHPRVRVPRPVTPKASRRRRRRTKPVPTQTGFEDLVAPRSQVLEFAKLQSNLLFPFKMLPKCTGTVSPGYPELQMPAVQASIECYPQQQQFLHYEPIQQFSPPSSPMYYEPIPFPATGMEFPFASPQPQPSFVPPTNAPAEVSTMVTTARMVNMVTTGESPTREVDMSTRMEILHSPQVEITMPRAPTIHDLSSPIMTAPADLEVSFTPQMHGCFLGVHDEQASGSEWQFNRPITSWSNGGSPIDWPNAIDCMPARPPTPQLEFPSPFMESFSPYMDLLVDSPIVMRAEESPTMVPEHVPVQLVPEQCQRPCFDFEHYEHIPAPEQSQIPYFVEEYEDRHIPAPEQSQIPYFVEEYEHRHIPAPTEPSFSYVESREHRHIPAPTEPSCSQVKRKSGTSHVEPGKHRQTKTKQQLKEGTTPEGSVPVVSAPVICGTSKFHKLTVKNARLKWTYKLHKRFEDAIAKIEEPTPRTVRYVMSVRGITLQQVKSHLQKYRINPHCFNYGNPSSDDSADLPPMRGNSRSHTRRRNNRRDSNASSSEQTARELADQQTLAQTLAMQQVMEESKELQAKIDLNTKEMHAKIHDMEKQSEHLHRMMDDQHEAMALMILGEAPAKALHAESSSELGSICD